jgi:asparagine synthase (glutamine-hydrolysing)
MLNSIAHRGPDHTGTYLSDGIALGNVRLSIIDLASGNQPIFNEDRSVVVVYNGEIYNFYELRSELVAKGHLFRTQSDTEVLVHLYEEEGIDMVRRLNGIFAFALHDTKTGDVFVARDRMGVKPLFYIDSPKGFYFASEMNPLKLTPAFSDAIDSEAFRIFLTFGYFPQPWTFFQSIRRLEAGHYVRLLPDGRVETHQYYDPSFSNSLRITREEAQQEILKRLSTAVKRQLISDVPVGVFLSGGLDSCSILAIATEHGANLETFTLSFAVPGSDENVDSSQWAKIFRAKHHRVMMDERDLVSALDGRIEQYGEPLTGFVNCGQMLLSRYAKDRGFKVMLGGAGGDELFCGYPTLNAAMFSCTYRRALGTGALRRLASFLPEGTANLSLATKIKAFTGAISDDDLRTFMNFKAVFSDESLRSLLTEPVYRSVFGYDPLVAYKRYEGRIRDWSLVDRLQYLDMKNFLEGAVLRGGDSATMSASVEERVPFLDNDLVDFACALPTSVRYHPFRTKTLLRSGLLQWLARKEGTESLLRKYKKRGFWAPVNYWMRKGSLGAYLRERLAPRRVERVGFFQPATVTRMLEDHLAGRANHDRRLQSVTGVMSFLESNSVSGLS